MLVDGDTVCGYTLTISWDYTEKAVMVNLEKIRLLTISQTS